jgi:phenylpropionate dioxygenase-like ring-hydroxylating dioxygenase large terminal subunit
MTARADEPGTPSALEMIAPRERAPAPLSPLRARGHYSTVHLPDQWFILARSRELRRKPLPRTLMGTPLVLFRDAEGRAATLLDRCPHRNVPLSMGRVAPDGCLECPYHGWRFDGAGACTRVPSLASAVGDARARQCASYPTVEQQGFVWVYSSAGESPASRPHRFARMDERGYQTVVQQIDMAATMYSVIENALDVPHTAFLHKGLFRGDSRGITITARVSRQADRVEAEYVGEPRPTGLMARLLSPSGGLVTHFDRFLLPSIAQVEYRLGSENHLLADTAMTPIDDFHTRLFGVVSFRTRFLSWLVRPFVKPVGMRVLKQDALMLARQTDTIRAFGGEQFASTEIDVLGKHIWRLLRAAERRDPATPEETTEVKLVV